MRKRELLRKGRNLAKVRIDANTINNLKERDLTLNNLAINASEDLYKVYEMFIHNQYPIMRRIALANRAKAVVTFDRVLNKEARA